MVFFFMFCFFWSLTVPGQHLLLFHKKEQREHSSKNKTGLDHHKNVHFCMNYPFKKQRETDFLEETWMNETETVR